MGKDSIKNLDVNVENILHNQYVCWGLRIILVLYAAMVAPNLNREISSVFDNVIVRLIVACLIVFLSFHDATLAILLAIAFVVSIQTLNKHKVNTITSLPESFYVGSGDDSGEMLPEEHDTFANHTPHGGHEKHGEHGKPPHHDASQEEKDSFADYQRFMNQQNEHFSQEEHQQQSSETNIENFENHQPLGEEQHGQEKIESFASQNNVESENSSNCGGPHNQFTTQAQLFDASNNLVDRNQINSVATFCPELNAQGSNPPSAYGSFDSQAVF